MTFFDCVKNVIAASHNEIKKFRYMKAAEFIAHNSVEDVTIMHSEQKKKTTKKQFQGELSSLFFLRVHA